MTTAQFVGWAKDDKGNTYCGNCNASWSGHDRNAWWPITVRWAAPMSWSPPWTHHGVEQGSDSLGRRLFSTTYHFGRFKVIFGSRYRGHVTQACPKCRVQHWTPVR